jgi:hypothetical protein
MQIFEDSGKFFTQIFEAQRKKLRLRCENFCMNDDGPEKMKNSFVSPRLAHESKTAFLVRPAESCCLEALTRTRTRFFSN